MTADDCGLIDCFKWFSKSSTLSISGGNWFNASPLSLDLIKLKQCSSFCGSQIVTTNSAFWIKAGSLYSSPSNLSCKIFAAFDKNSRKVCAILILLLLLFIGIWLGFCLYKLNKHKTSKRPMRWEFNVFERHSCLGIAKQHRLSNTYTSVINWAQRSHRTEHHYHDKRHDQSARLSPVSIHIQQCSH